MPAPAIFAVLANIPWGQVVENAPKVAESAAKLWTTVTSRSKDAAAIANAADNLALPSDTELLKAQVVAVREGVASLEDQMKATSELIKQLAEQNTQLVQRVEINRTRFIQFAILTGFICAGLLLAVVYILSR